MKDISEARLQHIREQQILEEGKRQGRAEVSLIALPFLVMALIGIIIMSS